MQLGTGLARELGDATLDRGVDVLVGRLEGERALDQLDLDPVERGEHQRRLLGGQQADARQHRDVRARRRDVVGRETPVERQALGEREQLVGRPVGEPTVPERRHEHGQARPARGPTSRPTRPQRRTKPVGVLVAERVVGVVGGEVVVVQAALGPPTGHGAAAPARAAGARRR